MQIKSTGSPMIYPDFIYPTFYSKRAASPKSLSSSSKSGSHEDDLEPAAGLASAAACMTLILPSGNANNHSHHVFSPTFTHQCFDSEHIRGYEPTIQAQEKSVQEAVRQREKLNAAGGFALPHVSFRHHVKATHHLDLVIRLSPSCRQCAILIQTQPKDMTSIHIMKKRKRLNDDDDDDDDAETKFITMPSSLSSNPSTCCLSSNASFSSSSSNTTSIYSSPAGRTRHCRMETDEILSRLDKAIPFVRLVSQNDRGNKKTIFYVHTDSTLHHESPGKKTKYTSPATATPPNNMKENDILDLLDKDFLPQPLGTIVTEYSAPIRHSHDLHGPKEEEMADFVMTIADGQDPNVKEYHDQVQKLSLWFIENADGVNVSSTEGGGFWQIIYLFRKHVRNQDEMKEVIKPVESVKSPLKRILSPARRKIHDTLTDLFVGRSANTITSSSLPQRNTYQYSLVGYMSLFSFSSPFKKPKGGIIQRICQVVILPPYQRAGHGKKMLQAVYQRAKMSESFEHEIVEINVEDPAPAFVALRDSVDYLLFRQECNNTLGHRSSLVPHKYLTLEYMEPLTLADATHAATLVKITPRQVQIAYEIYKLDMVMKKTMHPLITTPLKDTVVTSYKHSIEEGNDELVKKWMLMVKKRLNVSHKEVIGAYVTKEEKKAKLTHLFDETVRHYRAILGV